MIAMTRSADGPVPPTDSPAAETPASEMAAPVDHETTDTRPRTFLVVIDETSEMDVALYYACRRAWRTGGHVALLFVIEPAEFHHFMSVETLMKAEQREAAELAVQQHAREVHRISGAMAAVYIREGGRREELLKLLAEDPAISTLVLGAGTGSEGPGPLISHLLGKGLSQLTVPVTMVPGGLSRADLDAIT